MDRAYALLTVKAVDEERRVITGIATSPSVDRVGDIVEPLGVRFKNPLPLLWQHMHDKPIGTVKFDKPTKDGIGFTAELPRIEASESQTLHDRIEEAWTSIKRKLVRAVSIGFRPLEYSFIDNGGIHFQEIEVFELSAVTIPANAEATILTAKQFDTGAPAATGPSVRRPNDSPPASGKSLNPVSYRPKEGRTEMKNIGARIAELEATRKQKALRLEEIQSKALEAGRTKDEAEQKEFDTLRDEIKQLDSELKDLRDVEALTVAPTATTVVAKAGEPVTVPARVLKKEEPGVMFARLFKVKAVSRLDVVPMLEVCERMYGRDSEIHALLKAPVVPGTTLSGNWAVDLVGTTPVADFAAYLRSATIIGKFGQGGIPSLRRVPFREALIIQTGGGTGHWVGEGKPKPLTAFDFDRSTLEPLKVATISVLTEENIRSSNPSSELIIRDGLRDVLVEAQDSAFVDPANSGTANVKPASILNGAEAIVSTGDDADDIRLDARAVMQKFVDAKNPLTSGVWLMSPTNAIALGLMVNTLGQAEFPGIGPNGGTFLQLPVIVSEHMGEVVALVNAQDIYEADNGDIVVDMSREASLEMKDSSFTMDGVAGTGVAVVSLWQTNMVGFRAEKTINWKRRRASAVAYLTSVNWGGAVPPS